MLQRQTEVQNGHYVLTDMLFQKMQIILEYMVSQESQIAFLLGSKFDILFAVVTHPILTTVLLLLRKEN